MHDRPDRTRRESRVPEQARRDPVRPPAAIAGILYLQQTAGNAAVVQRQQGPWHDRVEHAQNNNDHAALFRLVREALPPAVRLVSRIGADRYTPMPVVNFDPTFTELLDRVMVGWNEPLAYRHHRAWGELLNDIGFRTRMVRVPDVLPYPHVVISATKAQ